MSNSTTSAPSSTSSTLSTLSHISLTPSVTQSSSSDQPTVSTVEPTVGLRPHPHTDAAAIVGGVVGTLCGLATLFLLGLLFWRRRKRRVLREKQMAIRRMTIVGPPSSDSSSAPPTLPYPFTGQGHRPESFDGTSFVDIEMAAKSIGSLKDEEAGLPWSLPPPVPTPTHKLQRQRAHRVPSRGRKPVPHAGSDSASLYSSKQSEVGEGDRMILVNGVYVLALEHENENEAKIIEENPLPPRPQD
ncbi:uncharacterized protein FOMMEDRAFT_165111 [Fomitiporia mediterranea MF3/22]|uniref:uncharacterized protein n=1 Tax=Fomitiporia mediterranea (strain MF3/22) TaxID=694068 RepID=UPI0004407F39|nr:uncharacterized protein FOMMEDRAFT_165111 [Fomitiporia mediterranea MF3/22]EJD08559.1 hypothetical protein FOMMEDRAFT_165111 [Fomitiporia mediterranea MF3/22]